MSDQLLRAACIHGRYEMHGTESTRTPLSDGGVEISNLCNGGREVIIDYEGEARKVHALVRSAYNQFPDEPRKPWDDLDEISKVGLIAMARDRVDAAIGDIPSTITSADWFNRDDNI